MLASRANGPAGAPGNADSQVPSISADGTRVAFESGASNLDDGDATAADHVHVRDLVAQTTTLASREGVNGAPGTDDSFSPAISGDGSRVAFGTVAPNLLPAGVTEAQVMVRTLATGTSEIGSRADGAAGAPAGLRPRSRPRALGRMPGAGAGRDPYAHAHRLGHAHAVRDAGSQAARDLEGPPQAQAAGLPALRGRPGAVEIGRKVKGKRYKRIARLTVAGRTGANTVRSKRKLVRKFRKGRYRVALIATDPAGNASAAVQGKLRVRR